MRASLKDLDWYSLDDPEGVHNVGGRRVFKVEGASVSIAWEPV